ncbi:uncharacterized protein LOC104889462 isoform X3 [Beta vulgaris subsp. vulgaris]|uniref:uncharacterized protein LOC104889462 isoform X3 n=1 Tax=Beta vulgaris subsp. vulgaris TaxID=3555 RepID=UPI0020370045|nr:uncharacterized protein LOC104889462 isoform X3 [Beta vulgaris subsp. vulgaris]
MSGGDIKGISSDDLQQVKNLIERCLQLYMTRKEVVNMLLQDANVMPSITELFQQNAGCYHQTGPSMRPERLQPPMAPSLPRPFTNGVPHMQTPAAFDVCTPSRTIDCLSDALNVQNSNSIGLMHGLNGGIVKSESGYPSDPQIFYDGDPNLGEAHGSMEDASFNGMEASSQPLNETLLGVNGSYGQLGHIPKLFSLPDLAYSNVLDNYTTSAFMTTETENFLDSRERGDIPEENKVGMTDSYRNYEDFASE